MTAQPRDDQGRMPNYPTLPHDDWCELDISQPSVCKCAVREAAWIAREGMTLTKNEFIARIVTGTPPGGDLKRGAEWQDRWDAYDARKVRMRAYIQATRGQARTSALLAYIEATQ